MRSWSVEFALMKLPSALAHACSQASGVALTVWPPATFMMRMPLSGTIEPPTGAWKLAGRVKVTLR